MEEEVRTQKRNLIIMIVAIVVVVLVGLTLFYCIMAKHQQGRFPAKTTINGIDVGGMTAERAKDELANNVESYTLTIQERGDVTETITAEDIGLTYVDSGDVDRLLEQFNPYLWIGGQIPHPPADRLHRHHHGLRQGGADGAGLNCF